MDDMYISVDERDWFLPYLVFNVERVEPLEQRMVEPKPYPLVSPSSKSTLFKSVIKALYMFFEILSTKTDNWGGQLKLKVHN